jgi:transposase-like protein
MRLAPLAVRCPNCSASDITYTCEPKCCFNHVCNDCHASFQLVAAKVGELPQPLAVPALPSDALGPTTGCPRCESIRVFRIEDDATHAGRLACADCGAVLELAFEDVARN